MRGLSIAIVVAVAASSAACAPRSEPIRPGPETVDADDPYYSTVRVVEPYGRAAQPELQSLVNATNEVFECVDAADCMVVDVGCDKPAFVAVNRARADDARRAFESPTCDSPASAGDADAIATCERSRCAQKRTRPIGNAAAEVTIIHTELPPVPVSR